MGLLLVVVPWSALWETNYFAETWPALQPVLHSSFLRVAVTCLGIINLVAGFVDLSLLFGAPRRPGVSVEDGTGPTS